jgi:Flp pilus assembly protein protease CpaA
MPTDATLPPSLRFLKWLVILLTLTMIGGVITVVGLLVTRMPEAFGGQRLALPDNLELPDGARPAAVTFGTNWIAVVTTEDRILIFDTDGTLQQEIDISPSPGP